MHIIEHTADGSDSIDGINHGACVRGMYGTIVSEPHAHPTRLSVHIPTREAQEDTATSRRTTNTTRRRKQDNPTAYDLLKALSSANWIGIKTR